MHSSDATSKPRRFFLRLGAIVFSLALLGVAELALRLFGYGGYPKYIRSAGKLPSGGDVCLVEPAASKPYFFANPSRPGYAEQTNFLMPKPPDTFRIFIIGESAAKGYPQPRNLGMGAFLEAMLEDRRPDMNVEIINLGTTASNESGLAPLGDDSGRARAAFNEAKNKAAAGQTSEARERFLDARDLDTLPWRPTRATEQAIREAATATGATLCDIAQIFRDESPGGATGWDLLDDHVHLSVQGHARAARAMADTIATMPELDWTNATLPDWRDYARRLGTNFYDDYRVNHTLRVLFGVPFMRESNPDTFTRFDRACRDAERRMPPPVLQEAQRWQTMTPHAGGLRPLAGMVARVFLAAGQPVEALPLYELAQRQVPDYTSWYLEYVYFALACREKVNGALDAADLEQAAHGIAQGIFLLAHGESASGLTERYVGRLHQLRNEWDEAIPYLLAARKKLSAEDLVACDQALVMSYIKTRRLPEARALVEDGIANSGSFAGLYRTMKNQLPETNPTAP